MPEKAETRNHHVRFDDDTTIWSVASAYIVAKWKSVNRCRLQGSVPGVKAESDRFMISCTLPLPRALPPPVNVNLSIGLLAIIEGSYAGE